MMKPGIGTYDRFKEMFEAAAKQAGKKYYLIPSLWPKTNRYRADQVQAFLPSPMAAATAMYPTGVNPLRGVRPLLREALKEWAAPT